SLAQRSIFTRCLDRPRGQRRSTKIRQPSLRDGGSYARFSNMDIRWYAYTAMAACTTSADHRKLEPPRPQGFEYCQDLRFDAPQHGAFLSHAFRAQALQHRLLPPYPRVSGQSRLVYPERSSV